MPLRPVVRLSRSPELAGRYSCDYYGHSVAIGLASRRRSHVRQCYTSERDLGVPFASFNALTGHRSCVPEDTACCCNSAVGTGAGYRRLSGGGLLTPSGDWDSGNPAFAISRGSSRRAAPYAWARPPVSWHAIVPFTFRVLGQPSDPEITPLISARCAGDITLRLVAQQQQSAATATDGTDLMRSPKSSELPQRPLSTAMPLDGKEKVYGSIP